LRHFLDAVATGRTQGLSAQDVAALAISRPRIARREIGIESAWVRNVDKGNELA
jgi:hypothetical protein